MKTVEATIFSFNEGLTNRKMISLISNYNDTQFNVEMRDFYIDDKK